MNLKNLGLAVFLSITVSPYTFAGTDPAAAVRCSEMAELAASGGDEAGKTLSGMLSDPDETVRTCAADALRGAGEGKNAAAIAALLTDIDAYGAARVNKGAFEDNLKARLKVIDSVWALGEIGDPRLMPKLQEFYAGSDNVLKINLLVSMGKLKGGDKAGPYLSAIAADTGEAEVVRAAAYEMLEHISYPAPAAALASPRNVGMEKGDLIFTGGIVGTISGWVSPDMPVGHSGIFAGTQVKDGRLRVVLADCVPNSFKPGGVRNIYAWHKFTRNYKFPFYGDRTSKVRPTQAQRETIVTRALAMGGLGLKYKLFQKGPAEYDCVNYTEFLYESAGLNPTPDSYESGAGWPFTPWEQFEATRPGNQSYVLQHPANNTAISDFSKGIIAREIGAFAKAFGMEAPQLPETEEFIRPVAASQD